MTVFTTLKELEQQSVWLVAVLEAGAKPHQARRALAPAHDFPAEWHYAKTSDSISLRVPTTASSGSQAVDIKPHIIAEHTVMLDASIKAKAKETSWSWPTAQDG